MRAVNYLILFVLLTAIAAWMLPGQSSTDVLSIMNLSGAGMQAAFVDCGECDKKDEKDDEELTFADCGECDKKDEKDDEELTFADCGECDEKDEKDDEEFQLA